MTRHSTQRLEHDYGDENMKILHILRSEPDELSRLFIKGSSQGETSKEVPMYKEPVNYDQLVKDIFENDKVICWW